MTDIVSSSGAVNDPTYGQNTRVLAQPAAAPASAPTQSTGPDPADLRLVIEENKQAGCFVYKTIDWRTGQVVQQFPSDAILKMREADGYNAGDVINSQA